MAWLTFSPDPARHEYSKVWDFLVAIFSAGLATGIESFRRARRARKDLDRIIDPVILGDDGPIRPSGQQ